MALAPIAWADDGKHPPRSRPYLNLPERLPLRLGAWITTPAFPHLRFVFPTWLTPLPHSDRLVVCEREGKIWTFRNQKDTKDKALLLDLSPRCQGGHECGLMSLAFHPQFGVPGSPQRGHFFVYYSFDPNPTARPDRFRPTRNRLSRFTLPDGAAVADPNSEAVLIDQTDRAVDHNAGGLLFHPRDGFLYLAVGDEGGSVDTYGNAQRLDGGLFAGVLRLDVGRDPSRSHPPPRQPKDGATAHYWIPNDNPFVGLPGALEEFYAIGLRNPYRLTCDPATGQLWCGDVGENDREEINLIEKGDNHQWSFKEGTATGPKPRPAKPIGVEKGPLFEYPHANADRAVIGGFVYRGAKFSERLGGKYLFGDYGSGRLWALEAKAEGPPNVVELCRLPPRAATLTGIGHDAAGEPHFLAGLEGTIHTLALVGTADYPLPPMKPLPPRLSETGAFADLASLKPAAGALPYGVNAPLWSDHAEKQRWAYIPPGSVDFKIVGDWKFPPGTVFVKHFELPAPAGSPAPNRRLETRFLVCDPDGGAYGVTYRWRPDGHDADLLDQGLNETVECRRPNGNTQKQVWSYPSRGDCMACHNDNAGFVLGLSGKQLNGEFAYPDGQRRHQLRHWRDLGLLRPPPSDADLKNCLKLAALDEPHASLDLRARSYLDANCSYCHRQGGVRDTFDARLETSPKLQFIVKGKPNHDFGKKDARIVSPGKPELSVLLDRLANNDAIKMPPLGRNVPDAAALATMDQWVRSLPRLPLEKRLLALGLPAVNAVLGLMLIKKRRRRSANAAPKGASKTAA